MATAPSLLTAFNRCLRPIAYSSACTRNFSITTARFDGKVKPKSKTPNRTPTKQQVVKLKQKKQRKRHPGYKQHDLSEAEQFSLCDAMRYAHHFIAIDIN
jgi:hypothetical protein